MAFRTSGRLQLLSLLLGLSSMDRSGAGAQEFQLLQPQGAVWVSPGENLTLSCSVTGNATAGPVKWFKGSGSGRQLVYADKEPHPPRVTRAVSGSDTDFTIRISDTRPEDTGIYHCVKFKKGSGADEEIRSGAGTAVSVSGHPPASPVAAAAGTVCVLLVVLFLVSTYFFVRKKRGRSLRTARSQTPFPDTMRTQSQPGANKDSDVLYADLQHSAEPQQPKKSVPAEPSEYAAVKVTQAIAR
ncbi:tyrosine-protein phosphatase non-receptor type substrate 1-like [Mauremys mutica]|uniref:tyrosine-protein phosphatase non-receptor type substrate 1-like n=1 Tax=Mauremys mutica TaxID=74926 RepID=UPI001D161C9C|nr:tyrosine-protein phosphatase non-receptor type substrate 1-like [Mauremys mutica]